MDDLNTPLSGPPAKRRRFRLPLTGSQAIAGVLALLLGVFVVWSVLVGDPLGGEPVVTAALPSQAAEKIAAAAKLAAGRNAHARYDGPGASAQATAEPPPGSKAVTIIDGSSGKRQQVFIPDPGAEQTAAGINDQLLEGSRHGRIPKIGPNGLRPVDAYAHRLSAAASKATGPHIAIVVGGLGISAAATADALSRLPPAITLAFAPYGADLDNLTSQARSMGHEVLLQAPMEPFDYPDNDPGPQTLLTSLPTEQNIDRLHWLMARFQGYVGLTNYMGARFTTSDKAMAPVLDDIGKRGLLYLDDGSSARSVAARIAAGNGMPFAKADEVLDAVTTPAEIDHALARIEALARKRGTAVATASALPVSIDRIARWAKSLDERGIMLVPLTAVALKAKSS